MNEEQNFKKDELEEMIDSMQKDASNPDLKFANKLRSELVTHFIDNSSNLHIRKHNMSMFSNKTIGISVAFLSILSIVGVGSFAYINRPGLRPTDISTSELAARLNSSDFKGNSIEAFTASGGAGGSDRKMASMLPYFEEKEYTYFKTTTKIGPKASDCYAYKPYGLDSYSNESYGYFIDGKHYSKWVEYDNDGKIYGYSLSTPEYTYDYAGGKIVGRAKAQEFTPYLLREGVEDETILIGDEIPVDMPTIEEPIAETPEPTVTDLFGPDAKILGEEKIGGKTYYVVSSSFPSYCDEQNKDMIITNSWFDSENYITYKTETYLNEVKSENLISINTNKFEGGKKELSEVEKNFVFDIDAQIVDFDPNAGSTSSEEFINALMDLLETQKAQVLLADGYEMNSYYSDMVEYANPFEFRYNRDFYRSDSLGDHMYKEVMDAQTEFGERITLLSSSFSKGLNESYKYLNIESINKPLSELDFEEKFGIKTNNSEEVKVKVGGIEQDAVIYPQETPTDCPDCTTYFYLAFEYADMTYVVTMDGKNKMEVLSVSYSILDSTKSEDLSRLLKMIEEVNKGNNEMIMY
jgi:hypothetical protein